MPSSKLLSANQLSLIRRSKPNKVITNKKEHFHSFHLKVFIAVFIVFPLLALAANTPPKASAGSSKVVIYPSATSTALSGSGSDAEGPVTFQWTQSGGPSTAIIAKPTSPSTTVSSLKPGLYTFKLTVKDNSGVTTRSSTTVSTLEKVTWTINGTKREALVHPSSVSGAAPVLFSFHGHTGTDSGWTKKAFEVIWPEAIVVYPQGLLNYSLNDSTCTKSGWQNYPGEINCSNGIKDQDLQFWDTMLNTLKKRYNVDSRLVFLHGWSQGGGFIYRVMWALRRNQIARLAPAGADLDTTLGKRPIPVIHTAGTQDELLAFSEQQRDNVKVRALNKCSSTGTKWASGSGGLLGTRYDSPINAPVVFLQYNGPHSYPSAVPPLIVKFFKEVAATITKPLITETSPAPLHASIAAR